MTRAGVQRPVRNVLLVHDGQRVDVGPERNRRRVLLAAADVSDQPRALRQHRGPQPGSLKAQRDPARRAVLGVTDLWMGVQIPAKLDQLRLMPVEKRVELAYQITLSHPPSSCGPGSGHERNGGAGTRGHGAVPGSCPGSGTPNVCPFGPLAIASQPNRAAADAATAGNAAAVVAANVLTRATMVSFRRIAPASSAGPMAGSGVSRRQERNGAA